MQESAHSPPTGDKSIVYMSHPATGRALFYFKYNDKFYTIEAQRVEEELIQKIVVVEWDEDPMKTVARQYLWCIY